MIMPWGEHEGEEVKNLPTKYLRWMFEEGGSDDIYLEADIEYRYRIDHGERSE